MKRYLSSHLVILTVVVFIVSRLVGMITYSTIRYFDSDLGVTDIGWAIQFMYAMTAISFVLWACIRQEVGLVPPVRRGKPSTWLPWLVLPIFILLSEGLNGEKDVTFIFILGISALFVAVNEEVLFRGIFVTALLRKGAKTAIFVPSILFGLIHLPNVLMGSDLTFSILQVVWAVLGGIALTCLRLRSGSLYPVIFIHFLVDFSEYISTGEVGIHEGILSMRSIIGFLFLALLLAIYEYWMFCKGNKGSILS